MATVDQITHRAGSVMDRSRAVDAAVAILGRRWTMQIVDRMMDGPRRFGDLRGNLNGISANVLTIRLGEMEKAGLVRRTLCPPPASVYVYELTDLGLRIAPVLLELATWAAAGNRKSVANGAGAEP
jgi:DNA-binding HxlR family transcriptional regulator